MKKVNTMGKVLWQVWLDDRLDNVLDTIKKHFHNSGLLKVDAKSPFLIYIIELFVEDYFKYLSNKLDHNMIKNNREFVEQFRRMLALYREYKDDKEGKNGDRQVRNT